MLRRDSTAALSATKQKPQVGGLVILFGKTTLKIGLNEEAEVAHEAHVGRTKAPDAHDAYRRAWIVRVRTLAHSTDY